MQYRPANEILSSSCPARVIRMGKSRGHPLFLGTELLKKRVSDIRISV